MASTASDASSQNSSRTVIVVSAENAGTEVLVEVVGVMEKHMPPPSPLPTLLGLNYSERRQSERYCARLPVEYCCKTDQTEVKRV